MRKRLLIPILASALFLVGSSFKSDFFEIAKQIEIFNELFKELNMNYVDETNPAQLMDRAIEGMLDGMDPYTKYWTEQEVENSKINRRGSYTGIGASVRSINGRMIIAEPWKDYPADKAGLKAGDEIIKIDNLSVKDTPDANNLLKGAAGTKVTLTYKRQGKTETATLEREGVDVDAVPFYKLLDDDIGYIVATKFNEKISKQVARAMQDLKEQGATSLILDLRGNPGGLLSEAIAVSNLFIPKGKLITETKSSIQKYNRTYLTKKPALDLDIPVAVLINGRSASASEIVSGSLQDYDRAVVVGARSYGKGLVQRPKPLSYGTQIKVTISRYYTPAGRCIQALDYWNRDENGNAVRTLEKDYNAFKTEAGRTVYDGGGVAPDIEVATAQFSPITTALLGQNAIFDYATQYYYSKARVTDMANFKLTDSDFADFKKWLRDSGFEFETETEKSFNLAFAKAEKEELDDDIGTSYNAMKKQIQDAKWKDIDDKKPEIMSLLTDELVKRYFYRDGLYTYQTMFNPEIAAARQVLLDKNKYNKILRK